jgi:hypothetical protein
MGRQYHIRQRQECWIKRRFVLENIQARRGNPV